MVKTDHILFIAAGAFHVSKPSDLIPELQGRFPIRVELEALGREDFVRILTEPKSALIKQYIALLSTEGVTLRFTAGAIGRIADFAMLVNERTENIGARRLHTVMEKLLDEISFEAPELDRQGRHHRRRLRGRAALRDREERRPLPVHPVSRRRALPSTPRGVPLRSRSVRWCACGKKGPPLPPLRHVPGPATDVSLRCSGNEVRFAFLLPKGNVQGQATIELDRVEVFAVTVAAGSSDPANRELLVPKYLVGTIPVKPVPKEGDPEPASPVPRAGHASGAR